MLDENVLMNSKRLWVVREIFVWNLGFMGFNVRRIYDNYGYEVAAILEGFRFYLNPYVYLQNWKILAEISVNMHLIFGEEFITPNDRMNIIVENFPRTLFEQVISPERILLKLCDENHDVCRACNGFFEYTKRNVSKKRKQKVVKIYIVGAIPKCNVESIFAVFPGMLIFETETNEFWTPRFGKTWIELQSGIERVAVLDGFLWPKISFVRRFNPVEVSINLEDQYYSFSGKKPYHLLEFYAKGVDKSGNRLVKLMIALNEKIDFLCVNEKKEVLSLDDCIIEFAINETFYQKIREYDSLIIDIALKFNALSHLGVIRRSILDLLIFCLFERNIQKMRNFVRASIDSLARYARMARRKNLMKGRGYLWETNIREFQRIIEDNIYGIFCIVEGMSDVAKFLPHIINKKEITAKELSEKMKVSQTRARQVLRKLYIRGFLERTTRGREYVYIVKSILKEKISKLRHELISVITNKNLARKIFETRCVLRNLKDTSIYRGLPQQLTLSYPLDFVKIVLDLENPELVIIKEKCKFENWVRNLFVTKIEWNKFFLNQLEDLVEMCKKTITPFSWCLLFTQARTRGVTPVII